jgi:hypothetical protein
MRIKTLVLAITVGREIKVRIDREIIFKEVLVVVLQVQDSLRNNLQILLYLMICLCKSLRLMLRVLKMETKEEFLIKVKILLKTNKEMKVIKISDVSNHK